MERKFKKILIEKCSGAVVVQLSWFCLNKNTKNEAKPICFFIVCTKVDRFCARYFPFAIRHSPFDFVSAILLYIRK